MIALVLAMVWSRRGQAVTLALLALLGVAAAVAAPAYLRAADRAVAARQVADAAASERTVVVSQIQGDPTAPSRIPSTSLTQTGDALTGLPGFDYVYAVTFPAVGADPDTRHATQIVYRQDACAHLVMVTGRCLVGEADVVLGDQTARRLRIRAGETVTMTYAVYNSRADFQDYQPAGAPKKLLVAGTYRVPDAGAPYWGTSGYFATPEGRPAEPAFINAATVGTMEHGSAVLTVDGIAGPGALAVDRLPALRAGLTGAQAQARQLGGGIQLTTRIPDLLARIDAGRAAAHLIVPVLAVALVLLACLTIFLAVGYSTEGRRPELAVVALRGARRGQRWWLATGESVVAILAGAVAGCVAGQLLVNAVAAVWFPGVGADPGLASLRYAPLAVLAAAGTALLAQRRQVMTPVADLLRRAPSVPRAAAAVAVASLVALLAVLAGVQLRITGGTLTGVGTFAMALITVALAQLAARGLVPAVTRFARHALGRGRPGVALAGFQLSRRPGAARLFALVAAAVAVTGYAAAAIDVAARDRAVQAEVATGAERVLSVSAVDRGQLVAAVHDVDPAGAYAMAAVRLTADPGQPTGLAVDATRLAAVAHWPAAGPSAAAVARRVRPPAPAPLIVPGTALTVDVTADGFQPGRLVGMTAVLSSVHGLGGQAIPIGQMMPGRHTYRQTVPACREGCRLNALLVVGNGALDVSGQLTVHGVGGVPAGAFQAARWRGAAAAPVSSAPGSSAPGSSAPGSSAPGSSAPGSSAPGSSAPGSSAPSEGPGAGSSTTGIRIDITTLNGLPDGLVVRPVDTPYPLPAAVAGGRPAQALFGLDGRALPLTPSLPVPAIPSLGGRGALVDLGYADLLTLDASPTTSGQVWLNAKAPPDIVQRLTAHGLVITSDVRADRLRRQLNGQGPALAVLFYAVVSVLAAALAAGALILAATVDRARRVEDLSALRGQGLSRAAVRQATLWTYPALVAVAALAGIVIAAAVWGLTGWALPLAGLDPPAAPLPGWPEPLPVVGTGSAVLAVLAAVAYAAGRRTLKDLP